MNCWSTLLVITLGIATSVSSVEAATRRGRGQSDLGSHGPNELNISGYLQVLSAEEQTETTMSIAGFYGRFLTSDIEAGLVFSYVKVEDYDAYGQVHGQIAYHFSILRGGPVLPYIAARAGVGYGYDENPTLFGAGIGAKAFISKGSAFTSELLYERQAYDTIDVNHFGVRIGMSFFF